MKIYILKTLKENIRMDYQQSCSFNTTVEGHLTSYMEDFQEESLLKCLRWFFFFYWSMFTFNTESQEDKRLEEFFLHLHCPTQR